MYGVSCLAMLANFLSGPELPASELVGLGAAETNETSAPGHSFFPGHPIVGAQYLERRPGLTITGEASLLTALLYIPANIRVLLAAGRGPALTERGE